MQQNKLDPEKFLKIQENQLRFDKNLSEEIKQQNEGLFKLENKRLDNFKDSQDKNRKFFYLLAIMLFGLIILVVAFSFYLISEGNNKGLSILSHFGTALLAFISGFGLAKKST